jgi:hypothetical protein
MQASHFFPIPYRPALRAFSCTAALLPSAIQIWIRRGGFADGEDEYTKATPTWGEELPWSMAGRR